MRQVLKLARRGLSRVHPNPMVGAVVIKNGRLVGVGYHRRFGGPHAEVEALAQAGTRAKGSTVYVNLEPCSHWGKTPPCADALIDAGVARVVAAMRDPNPLVAGKGARRLRAAGIRVDSGVLEKEAQELNRAFLTWVTERRPYVTLKTATSLDGKIATAQRESKWITGPDARHWSHRLRAEVDAIAVGVGTVLADNPSLTAHGRGRNPLRIIFDSRLRTPKKALCLDASAPTWILTHADPSRQRARWPAHVRLQKMGKAAGAHVDIVSALRWLASEGITHVLVEGGGELNASFLEAGVVDEVIWFLAPMLIGGRDAPSAVQGGGVDALAKAHQLKQVHVTRVGHDICIRGKLRVYGDH